MSIGTPEFHFVCPPEAPVFKPTWEEFQDALGYINKIRPIAEQSGICKVIPPPDWQPPFAVDVDNFKFTPRIQRLNELEAHTRIKLNFLDQIAKFWELQGSSLKIPVVERKALDLYSLHKNVHIEGGSEAVSRDRKWNKIASRMGFPANKNLGTLLKSHYERIIHPYDIFNKGKCISLKKEERDDFIDNCPIDKDYKPHKIPSRMAGKIPESEKNGRRSKRYPENQCDSKCDSELAKYICLNCGRGDAEDQMLLCDGCDDSYHTFCLIPRLPEIPKGDWRCPKCVAVEVSKPLEAFGFEQAQKEYTLQSFGEMADKFKQDYFSMPVHLVPLDMAEREFWRIVSSIDEDVTVEYGADLHTMDHGSGFPTKNSKNLLPADQEYALSSWNLNNLPVVEGSVLGHINCDISGMKVPWMYVGMCFSTFCWHNEDHWSYSINYLHWGEPKTWYGVSGGMAEEFEKAMRGAAPELFDAQPDLLHQLVTIMNPNIVMKAGVPIVRTDQHAGEFIITFPRSYHAGFNQGYNFAEAVNFCPPDWLSIGRECVLHYSNLKRYCVFSHDELVCKMATVPDDLDLTVAAATYQDLLRMVDLEKKLRKNLLQYGITNAEREAFELLPDDERQCDFCKTTCFLSAVTCTCTPEKLVCLRHYKQLCECAGENKTLRYRYTLDELPPMLHRLKIRAESFDNWAAKVKEALEAKADDKLELSELRELVEEAESQKFPDSELLQTLIQAVTEADKCATVAAHLATKKVRTRTRGSGETKTKLTMEELRLFYEQIESLACIIKEGDAVKELLVKVNSFREEAEKILMEETPDADLLAKQVEAGCGLDIDLPELPKLKHKLQQVEWLDEVEENVDDKETLTVECIRKLLDDGILLPPSPRIEHAMAKLHLLLSSMEKWEGQASKALGEGMSISQGEELLSEAENIHAMMPTVNSFKDAVKRAREWINKVEAFEGAEHAPLLETVESLVAKGKPIPIKLKQLPVLEENVSDAHLWLEKTSRTFLKKNSHYSLLEVLLPRTDIGVVSSKRKRVKKDDMSPQQQLAQLLDISVEDTATPSSVVKAYKDCEERELGAMRAIRAHNKNKSKNDDLATFCSCHKAAHGNMLLCSLCSDQFHTSCIPSHHRSKVKLSAEGRFICISCERSKRPRLETILSLLVSLQKLPVRIPEAEALQCLTERAMLWQDKARQLLQTDELATALGKLSVFSQKLVEAQNKQKETLAPLQTRKDIEEKMDDDSGTEDETSLRDVSMEKDNSTNENGNKSDENGWEHAYSSFANKSGRLEVDKTKWNKLLNSVMTSDDPLISFSSSVKQEVQDLLVIGELLEVNLDESTHLWSVLQASNLPPSQLQYTLLNLNSPNANSTEELKGKKAPPKKRKSEGQDESNPRSPSKSPIKKIKNAINERSKGMVKKRTTPKTGVGRMNIKDGIKRKKGTNPKPRRTKVLLPGETAGGMSSDSDDEIDERCAADNCMKPFGSNVQWVQCDGCDLWFHYVCVGLCQKDISEDEDYLCSVCLLQPPPLKPGELTEEESVDILLSLANSAPAKDTD